MYLFLTLSAKVAVELSTRYLLRVTKISCFVLYLPQQPIPQSMHVIFPDQYKSRSSPCCFQLLGPYPLSIVASLSCASLHHHFHSDLYSFLSLLPMFHWQHTSVLL